MVDRAGDSKFSTSEKEKLKRFVALILAKRIAKRKRPTTSSSSSRGNGGPVVGSINPSDVDTFGFDSSGHLTDGGSDVSNSGSGSGSAGGHGNGSSSSNNVRG